MLRGKHLGKAKASRVLDMGKKNAALFNDPSHAHLVHSDLNPTNILVAQDENDVWNATLVLD